MTETEHADCNVRDCPVCPDVTCRYCERVIVLDAEDGWIDPEAPTDKDEDGAWLDDAVWRVTCDSHDSMGAEHEPLGADGYADDEGRCTCHQYVTLGADGVWKDAGHWRCQHHPAMARGERGLGIPPQVPDERIVRHA